MALALVARTILAEAVFEPSGGGTDIPFGRTGCALLPDGTYVVAVWITDEAGGVAIRVWKIDEAGSELGSLDYAVTAPDGRAHLIALDGFMVQMLHVTGGADGESVILDCSGDIPSVMAVFGDALSPSGVDYPVGSLRLPGLNLVAVCGANGVTLYRRGRPMDQDTTHSGGNFGPFPHPTDPTKFAVWYESSTPGSDFDAVEYAVGAGDTLTSAVVGDVDSSANWTVGAGSPFAGSPLALQEEGDKDLVLLGIDSTGPSAVKGINNDPVAGTIGDGQDRFVFAHEVFNDSGEPWPQTTPRFALRVGIADRADGLDMLELVYGVSSPDGLEANHYVSLSSGSHSVSHRNGEIVAATCVVEQLNSASGRYYSVISWKLTGGEVAALSGRDDGAWRLGINNATGRLNLQTSGGMLPEASEAHGVDAPARPAYVKTSDGWVLLGRFVDTSEPDLPAP